MNIRRALSRLLLALSAGIAVTLLYGLTDGASPMTNEPFANAVQQRAEMIEHLKNITAELRTQNELLRSGTIRVSFQPQTNSRPPR